jgi:hypothetical protein
MEFNFWKKSAHYDLGYRPDHTGVFATTGAADEFATKNGYECFDDAVTP